jgi:hypothetical protein
MDNCSTQLKTNLLLSLFPGITQLLVVAIAWARTEEFAIYQITTERCVSLMLSGQPARGQPREQNQLLGTGRRAHIIISGKYILLASTEGAQENGGPFEYTDTDRGGLRLLAGRVYSIPVK